MSARDGWDQLLSTCLGQLRECARKLELVSEHICYSLELSALKNVLDGPQCAMIAQTALKSLLAGDGFKQGDAAGEGGETKGSRQQFEYHIEMGDAAGQLQESLREKSQQEKSSKEVLMALTPITQC